MSNGSQEPDDSRTAAEGKQSANSSTQHPGPLQELLSWRTLLDMFTGKYIYNYYTGRSANVVKAS